MNKFTQCPICDASQLQIFFRLKNIPLYCNVIHTTQESAINTDRADIDLAFCQNCGHVFNSTFDEARLDYDVSYENALGFSPRFLEYAQQQTSYLIDKYNLQDKTIIDIGCGQGDFLKMICHGNNNKGIGFDPSFRTENGDADLGDHIKIYQDYYSEQYARYSADLICSRQVLEHIYQPQEFITMIRNSIGARLQTNLFLEVPNVLYTLRDMGIWDLIYEHFSYYNAHSLRYLLTKQGFVVHDISETYVGQYLTAEAVPVNGQAGGSAKNDEELHYIQGLVNQFSAAYDEKKKNWAMQLKQFASEGQRTVIWGSGSKGVTFLNALAIRKDITHVVDINPRKQDKYVAGTGQRIVPPSFLNELKPDNILVMNAIYLDEIKQTIDDLQLKVNYHLV